MRVYNLAKCIAIFHMLCMTGGFEKLRVVNAVDVVENHVNITK